MKTAILFLLIAFLFKTEGYGQDSEKENIPRIVSAYLNFFSVLKKKPMDKNRDVIVLFVKTAERNSFSVEVSCSPENTISYLKYDKLYRFEGYRMVVQADTGSSGVLKGLFTEIPNEKFRSSAAQVHFEPYTWWLTCNAKYEVFSISSGTAVKLLLKQLRKHKVKIAADFSYKNSFPPGKLKSLCNWVIWFSSYPIIFFTIFPNIIRA